MPAAKQIHGTAAARVIVGQIAELIYDFGCTPTETAHRMGYTLAALEKRCGRIGRHDLEAMFARERRAVRKAA